jgi:hypothetical protein
MNARHALRWWTLALGGRRNCAFVALPGSRADPHSRPACGLWRSFDFAQDFGSRLPIRSRLLIASSSTPAAYTNLSLCN